MRKAYLVRTSFVTRIIASDEVSEEMIIEAARFKLVEQVKNELHENIEEVVEDKECPPDAHGECKYYSLFDRDLNKYNYTCLNSKTKRECLENYLLYRGTDYWGEDYPEDEEKARKEEPEQNILDDIAFCNFELIGHDVPIQQD